MSIVRSGGTYFPSTVRTTVKPREPHLILARGMIQRDIETAPCTTVSLVKEIETFGRF